MPRIRFAARYSRKAAAILTEAEHAALIEFIQCNPSAGDIVAGTGGVRKVRWRLQGQGKRGGARVLHLYLMHKDTTWLLDIYAKRDKLDLTPADKADLRGLVEAIKKLES